MLDTQPEEAFDRITRLVKVVLEMPMAVVSLVDRDRQWFKSKQGVKAAETPRNISFCTHTIQGTEPLIVNDAHADPRFANSPLVIGDPHIRFYVGVPLRSRDGYNVGALCSMDTKARDLSPEQITVLEDLARLIVDELELRVQASTDVLTGVMSRRAFKEQGDREIARAKRYGSPLSCALIDADYFKSINDTHGHGVGDLALKHLASICSRELRTSDCIGRIGGEEFAIMLPETDLATAMEVSERLRKIIASSPLEVNGTKIKITASIGVAQYAEVDEELRRPAQQRRFRDVRREEQRTQSRRLLHGQGNQPAGAEARTVRTNDPGACQARTPARTATADQHGRRRKESAADDPLVRLLAEPLLAAFISLPLR